MGTKTAQRRLVGRRHELALLEEECRKPRASLVAVYGRRRVGKTRLVTEFYKDKNLWSFEGVEDLDKRKQIKNLLEQLCIYTGDDVYKSINCDTWLDFLKALEHAISNSETKHNKTIFLDELPYMCGRRTELVSALKWAWDNFWQDKEGFTLVLCGSTASFMIKKVVRSSSLYGRVKLEICLRPLSAQEVHEFFERKRSPKEICDLYMFCGGIPEYLLQIRPAESIAQNMARLAFCKDGYFVQEFDRLFKDILGEEKTYKKIVLLLSRYKSLKAPEMTEMLGASKGGGFVEYLENLESASFIKSIVPWDKPQDSKLKRYCLDDEYLLFYFKFIYPNLKKIQTNTSIDAALSILRGREYKSWAGLAFEHLCLKHVKKVMEFLHIDQLVKDYGAYFDRATNTKEGVQIDLLFIRHDPVVTICELKYYDGLISKWIMDEVERKVALLGETTKTVEKVLITTDGITKDLQDTNYFSRVIRIDELFATQ